MKRGTIETAARGMTRVTRLLFLISEISAALLLIIVFLDVIFRRLRLPLSGGMELTEAIFCALCFFSFAFAWVKGDHIRVGVFIERAPRRARKAVALLSALIGVFVFGCLTYSEFNMAWFSLTHGDTTANLHLPRALPQLAIVLGALVFCLQIVAQLPAELRRVDEEREQEDSR